MKTTINEHAFCQGFAEVGRGTQFSLEARKALFEYFEEYEDGCCCDEMEYDPIAICCEWSEMTADEIIEYYSVDIEAECSVVDYLADRTQYIELDNGSFVFGDF